MNSKEMKTMSSYYDAFGGTSTEAPDDPYADELELDRVELAEDMAQHPYRYGLPCECALCKAQRGETNG